jgi:hypothetical protein
LPRSSRLRGNDEGKVVPRAHAGSRAQTEVATPAIAKICNVAVGAKARFYVQVFMQLDMRAIHAVFAGALCTPRGWAVKRLCGSGRSVAIPGPGTWAPAFAGQASFDQLLDHAFYPVAVGQRQAGQPDANAFGVLPCSVSTSIIPPHP